MQLLNPNVSLSELRELVMDREAWRAVIHWVAKSRTRLSDWTELNWMHVLGFLGGASGKEPSCQCRRGKKHGFYPWVGKIPWKRAWQPTLVFLPGESHGQRSLVGYRWTQQKRLSTHPGIKSSVRCVLWIYPPLTTQPMTFLLIFNWDFCWVEVLVLVKSHFSIYYYLSDCYFLCPAPFI